MYEINASCCIPLTTQKALSTPLPCANFTLQVLLLNVWPFERQAWPHNIRPSHHNTVSHPPRNDRISLTDFTSSTFHPSGTDVSCPCGSINLAKHSYLCWNLELFENDELWVQMSSNSVNVGVNGAFILFYINTSGLWVSMHFTNRFAFQINIETTNDQHWKPQRE